MSSFPVVLCSLNGQTKDDVFGLGLLTLEGYVEVGKYWMMGGDCLLVGFDGI